MSSLNVPSSSGTMIFGSVVLKSITVSEFAISQSEAVFIVLMSCDILSLTCFGCDIMDDHAQLAEFGSGKYLIEPFSVRFGGGISGSSVWSRHEHFGWTTSRQNTNRGSTKLA